MAAIIRGILGYCFLVFLTRIVGRRPGKQIAPFDFVLVFFMGGVTLTAMVGDDRSFTNACCIIATLALTHTAIAWAKQRWPAFGRIVDGTPLLLVEKGKRHDEIFRRMAVTDEDVMAMGRDNGLRGFQDLDYAVLERNGEISVIPKSK